MNKIDYFPHDTDASNDPKITSIRLAFGWKAIGMYWAIIELLHKEKNGELPQDLISSIIFDFYSQEEFRTSSHIIEEAKKFENSLYANALLIKCERNATSERVKNNLEEIHNKSDKARQSAEKRWGKTSSISEKNNEMRTHSERNANAMLIKERKGKERIDNIIEISKIQPIVEKWNSCNVYLGSCRNTSARRKLLPVCLKITPMIEKTFEKLKEYPIEDFKKAIENYAQEIINRDPANDYANHRFSFYEFFTQKNGFIKFLNR